MTALESYDDLEGYGAAHGMPPMVDMTLDRLCAYVWYMLIRNQDQAGRERLKAKLWRPPPGEDIPRESPWSKESETASFKALRASLSQ